jgi:hypothetical protein
MRRGGRFGWRVGARRESNAPHALNMKTVAAATRSCVGARLTSNRGAKWAALQCHHVTAVAPILEKKIQGLTTVSGLTLHVTVGEVFCFCRRCATEALVVGLVAVVWFRARVGYSASFCAHCIAHVKLNAHLVLTDVTAALGARCDLPVKAIALLSARIDGNSCRVERRCNARCPTRS